jgi:Xaa-Pro aminopeptidase
VSATRSEPIAGRVTGVADAAAAAGVDALLVSAPLNVRYVTGFTGSSGLALISARPGDGARTSGHRFITDFRYATQASQEVAEAFDREVVADKPLDAVASYLESAGGRLGFEEASLTVGEHRRLGERLSEGWRLVACEGIVEGLRAVKDAGELERIRAAAALSDEALSSLLGEGIVGRSERDVATELELRMRKLGAEGASFEPIVAAGPHGALPHATPRDQQIGGDVLVTIDWGAKLEGYCSDCTRTFATGEQVSRRAREVYELVREAQELALQAVRAGKTGRELDAVARRVIERAGHGERFGHGLGHGVGLDVHEAPRLSRTAGALPLRPGNVVTIEPGVYLPGELGVRIEDLVIVTEDGGEAVTAIPKELTVIG